jgi:hypothetical protein
MKTDGSSESFWVKVNRPAVGADQLGRVSCGMDGSLPVISFSLELCPDFRRNHHSPSGFLPFQKNKDLVARP